MTLVLSHGTKCIGERRYSWRIAIEKGASAYTLSICPMTEDYICSFPVFVSYYQTEEKAKRAMRNWFARRGIK